MTFASSILEVLFTPFLLGIMGSALWGRVLPSRTIPGLLFHSVPKNYRPALSAIPRSRFKSIVYCLKSSGFVSRTLSKAFSRGCSAADVPQFQREILLTFDDGCRTFFTQVLPLLEEWEFKATVFLVAGYLGKTSSWDVMSSCIHLTKAEIMEISDLGHEIGSHGLTHADFTYLKRADLWSELIDSKKILEDSIGKKVTALSFPYGSWNTRVWELAQEAGYTCGTIYRKHRRMLNGLFPVYGVYSCDTPQNVLARIAPLHTMSLSVSCARIMSHFSKGAPLWKFDKKYIL
jgi:peptidoglycan/xylan/chitin deacetylase (PgdA/CDA1 family)